MTAENPPNISDPGEQVAKPVRTLEALLKLYSEGHRNFSGSDLRGATVDIIDSEILFLDLKNIILRGSNLKAVSFGRSSRSIKVDLAGTDFSECNLQGANLSRCRLDQCNFKNSDLRRIKLSESSCRGSDFICVKFSDLTEKAKFSNFSGADFTASNFTGADLRSIYISGQFSYVDFRGADFQKSSFAHFHAEGADFSDANLQNIEFPTPTTVSLEYSYYNHQTKFSDDFDPIIRKMELIENNISTDD